MSDSLRISNSDEMLARALEDIAELKRRARVPDVEQHDSGCCDSYCCEGVDQHDLEVGESFTLCTVDPDPVGGEAIRLKVRADVELQAQDAGAVLVQMHCEVDGTTFIGKPRWIQNTVEVSDTEVLNWGWTIDAATADPTVEVKVQNMGTPTIRVVQHHVQVDVGPADGSIACGQAAGTSP